MNETQQSISAWADETFGEAGSDARVAARANEELSELLRLVTTDDFAAADVADECADVCIVLYRLAERHHIRMVFPSTHFSKAARAATAPRMPILHDFVALANASMSTLLIQLLVEEDGGVIADCLECIAGMMYEASWSVRHDLRDAIDAKMAVNRAREWKRDGSGHGYHVRERTA